MLKVIQGQYFWNQMRADLQETVAQCAVCQTSATLVTADRVLHPIPVLHKGERWHIDLIGPLEEGRGGYKYAVVAFDSCTKWPEAGAIPSKSAEQVEAFVYKDIICRFPAKEIVCDNGTEFAGDFEVMAKDLGLKVVHTAAYHPQANGAVERFNQTLKKGLAAAAGEHRHSWPDLIPRILRSYRQTPQRSTGLSPAEMMMGKKLPILGAESSAWMRYVEPSEENLRLPQGEGWIGWKVEKLFSHPTTGSMTIYSGVVTDFQVTRVGQERVSITYEDGDNETCEPSMALPWILLEHTVTWLEKFSSIELEGLERVAHMYLSMLEIPGSLRSDAQALALKDPRFVREHASSFRYKANPTPAEQEADPDPGPSTALDNEALREMEEIQADKENMAKLELEGMERNAVSQAQMAQSYANRRKPRNKRVEPMEVGSFCRICPPIDPNARGKSKIVWSQDLFRIRSMGRGRVLVEKADDPTDVQDLLPHCVLPVAPPRPASFMGPTSA